MASAPTPAPADPSLQDPAERWDRPHTRELFLAYRATRDVRIRNEIVIAHLNLVKYAMARYANHGLLREDLYQVGCVGLIKAVESYRVDMGTQFITYAMPTIAGEIKHYLRDNAWSVQVPRRLKELCLGVARAEGRLARATGRPPSATEIASAMQLPEEQILATQDLANCFALSLDADCDPEHPGAPLAPLLGRDDEEFHRLERRMSVKQLLLLLPRRDRLIVYLRYFRDCPLRETAEILGISAVHVSRVVGRVLAQLRALLLAPGGWT